MQDYVWVFVVDLFNSCDLGVCNIVMGEVEMCCNRDIFSAFGLVLFYVGACVVTKKAGDVI